MSTHRISWICHQDVLIKSIGRATPKGWINTESFRFWVKNIFIKNIPPVRPILLLFDGHGSHIDFQTSKICKENEIELLCLPPHTSHLIQPLDVGVFGPMKQAYRRECDLNSTSLFNAGTKQAKTIDKFTFGRLFKAAFLKSMTSGNVIRAFEASGLWPKNPSTIAWRKCEPAKTFTAVDNGDSSQPTTKTIVDDTMSDSFNTNIDFQKTSTPVAEKTAQNRQSMDINDSGLIKALKSFENSLSKNQLTLYNKRYEIAATPNPVDYLYEGWKSLKTGVEKEKSELASIIKEKCKKDESTKAARRALLTLPSAPKAQQKQPPNERRHHLTSDESLSVLEESYRSKQEKEQEKQAKQVKTNFSSKKTKKFQKKKSRQQKIKDI